MVSGNHIHTAITASGVRSHETAARLFDKLLKTSTLSRGQLDHLLVAQLPRYRLGALTRRPRSRIR